MTDITSPHKKDIPVYQTDRAIRSVRSIFCTGFSVAVILQCSLLGSGCSPSTPATTEKNTTAILSTSNELDAATPKITVDCGSVGFEVCTGRSVRTVSKTKSDHSDQNHLRILRQLFRSAFKQGTIRSLPFGRYQLSQSID